MKKLITCILCLFLFSGCSLSSKAKSVKSITLTLEQEECFKQEEIKISVKTNSRYRLKPEDFVIFGGDVRCEKDTAYLTFHGAGTFHVYAKVNNVESNELTIPVRSNLMVKTEKEKEIESNEKTKIKIKIDKNKEDPIDFNDINALRNAPDEYMISTEDLWNNPFDYTGIAFPIEGTIPEDSDGSYLITKEEKRIPLSGVPVTYGGKIRAYGMFDGKSFVVYTYAAFYDIRLPIETESSGE